MSDNLPSPKISAIFDAYIDDARFRGVSSVGSLVSHGKRIIEFLGDVSFEHLARNRNSRMRDFINWRRSHMLHRRKGPRPTSDSTIDREIRNLQAALNFAAKADDDSPIRVPHTVKLLRPKANGPRRRVIDRHGADGGELARLKAEMYSPRTPAHTALAVEIALRTGQRRGAIHGLRWSEHIDFDAGMIYFTRTARADGKVWADNETKKKRADKPMSPALRDILIAAKARATCDGVIEWGGKPVANTSSSFKALLKRAGISEATFHDLRRTSATIVRQGLSLEKAAEHIKDSIATTDRVYAQADPRANLEAQLVIDQALAF